MPPDAELARLLDDLRPAELALRDWVRTRLNASIVRERAVLDHGMQVEEHRQGIEALLVARRPPEELAWTPREVLELTSYEVPADPERRPGSVGWRRHVARLFSSLVLVRATDAGMPAEILARLVESALELGPEATDHAVRDLRDAEVADHVPHPGRRTWQIDVSRSATSGPGSAIAFA